MDFIVQHILILIIFNN